MLFQAFFGAFVRWRVNQKIRELPPLHKMVWRIRVFVKFGAH